MICLWLAKLRLINQQVIPQVSRILLQFPLHRLNKQKLDKLRQDYGENAETYKGYHHLFWAFSKTPLTQPLTKITTPEVEQQALQISMAILTYAGLNPNSKINFTVYMYFTMLFIQTPFVILQLSCIL